MKYQPGTVIWVSAVEDTRGLSKDRFVVLVREYDDAAEEDGFGVAVSTKYDTPLPETQVKLPYGPSCKTGLRQESVAVCDWFVVFEPDRFQGRRGFIPARDFDLIQEQVLKLLSADPSSETPE